MLDWPDMQGPQGWAATLDLRIVGWVKRRA